MFLTPKKKPGGNPVHISSTNHGNSSLSETVLFTRQLAVFEGNLRKKYLHSFFVLSMFLIQLFETCKLRF